MSEFVTKFLKKQGFNDKDIAVYLDIFAHGQSFASSIGLRTKIDRTTVYAVLKRLVKEGIVLKSVLNEVAVYMAVSPEIFVRNVDADIDELLNRKHLAQSFVKEMAALSKKTFFKPKVRVYEGDKAIINLYEETLEKPGEQKAFINLRSIPTVVKQFLKGKFIKSKLEKGVKSKVLVADGPNSEKYKSLDKISNRETLIVKNSTFDLHSEIILFNKSSVAIIDFNKPIYGIVFESKTFYGTMEVLFDLIWKIGADLKSKK